ncbi:MAG: sigma 54-interacting transcriptional regulator [Candidatus Rokuibacteriota bacterium]
MSITYTHINNVLQTSTAHRVGRPKPFRADARIVSATNQDLAQMCCATRFRYDLYSLLSDVTVHVPPLRERGGEDIALLARYFLEIAAAKSNRHVTGFRDEAMRALVTYPWPGNEQELEHVVERAVIGMSTGALITLNDVAPELQPGSSLRHHRRPDDSAGNDERVRSDALFESHPWLFELRSVIESAASTDADVLLHGESSRMSELVARAIHESWGHRAFSRFNCSDSSPIPLEVELFGAEGKTSGGTLARKAGLLEFPCTLYLENIADLPLALQGKLLTALQERRLPRAETRAPTPVRARVIAVTNRDLGDGVARGQFSEELAQLLRITEILVPPLTKEERDMAIVEEEEQARREEEQARRERAWREPIDAHNEACGAFARTGPAGLPICPHCGRGSRQDIEFVDYSGQGRRSFFVCQVCGRSFGHEL